MPKSLLFALSISLGFAIAVARANDDPPPDAEGATVSDDDWFDAQRGPNPDKKEKDKETSLRPSSRRTASAPPRAAESETPSEESTDTETKPRRLADRRSALAVIRESDPVEPKPVESPPDVSIAPAQFNGAQPEVTRRADLIANWGEPKELRETEAGQELEFALEPFEKIVVSIVEDHVDTIIINLVQPIEADRLAQELKLGEVRPVTVRDQRGRTIGEAYPERGVVFSFANKPRGRETKQILLAPIDPEAFLLRAETSLHRHCEQSLRDLTFVIENDAENAYAYWLRAELQIDLARYPQALRDAEEAVRLDAENSRYEATLCMALNHVGQPVEAKAHAETAVKLAPEGSAEKAYALLTMAECHNYGDQQDYEGAVALAQQAIKIAGPLVQNEQAETRALAQRTLLKAYLSTARDVAWGAWKRKTTAVPMWLERAEVAAQEIGRTPQARGDEMFLVAREALAAYVGMQGEGDPKKWADLAIKFGGDAVRGAEDPLAKSRSEWELGLALYDALQICHVRRAFPPAIEYGKLAVSYLEQAGSERAQQPGHAYMMGRLYFRIGSIYAVQQQDHDKAMPWFEKAVPLLEEPIPDSSLADIGRQGETFVSVAVSYWSTGRRSEAISLTKEGLRLMDQAVDEGLLERTALLVPYGNLARMHEQLGDKDEAKRYLELASGLKATTKR